MDYITCLQNAEFFEYTDLSGMYVIRPNACEIWENIQKFLDTRFKKLGIRNAYFPLFVSKANLEIEKDHINGFAPEVCWVTKCGSTELEKDEEFAVRPTSETIMYPHFAKWINSHKQLPFKINQWVSVVRCEMKDCTPFLRSKEFYWHEGHTAHSSQEEAQQFVLTILDLYEELYESMLAVPVIKGEKTQLEKFAGGLITTTVECFIPSTMKAIQAATSHNLGFSFGKMFGIEYDTDCMTKAIPCQTSFGLTTRSIGIMTLTHMDEKGMVLPPNVASTQIVIIPIYNKKVDQEKLIEYVDSLAEILCENSLRVIVDSRKEYTPGWKYNYYEGLGIPLRIEIGQNELQTRTFTIVSRYDSAKNTCAFENWQNVKNVLNLIQLDMFRIAKTKLNNSIVECTSYDEFIKQIKAGKMVITPWNESSESEENIKLIVKDQGENIKTLCKPYYRNITKPDVPCFFTGLDASCYVMWGKSY